MFDVGGSEILLILVLTLLVMGPKNIPKVARTLGHFVQQVRRVTNEFKHALDDEIHALEIDELKKNRPTSARPAENTIDRPQRGATLAEPSMESPAAPPADVMTPLPKPAESESAVEKEEP